MQVFSIAEFPRIELNVKKKSFVFVNTQMYREHGDIDSAQMKWTIRKRPFLAMSALLTEFNIRSASDRPVTYVAYPICVQRK